MTDDVRRHPSRPIVCVGAVIIHGGRVVLVQRAQPPLQGEWSLPGGVVEVGETLEEAVAREVLEETGLIVDVEATVEVLDRIHRGDDDRVEYHYVVIDYLCTPRGGALSSSSDAADARWVHESDVPTFGPTPKVLEVVAKAFAQARARTLEPENPRTLEP